MSDDSSPSSPARIRDPLLPRSNDDDDDGAGAGAPAAANLDGPTNYTSNRSDGTTNYTSNRSDGLSETSRHRQDGRRRRRSNKKRNPGLAKKLDFISHLLKTLDLVVFAELSALYYMECSMFLLALRSLPQYMFLTPKDETWPFHMPATRLHVIIVIIPTIICMLFHLFGSLPEGPEHHRGYQHGGIVIDFIGQKPPTWRMYYFLADVAIVCIQCLMLTIHTERERLRVVLKTFRPRFPEEVQEVPTGRTIQDLDAEERGFLRDTVTVTVDETDTVEMRPLQRRSRNPGGDAGRGNEAEGSRRSTQAHLRDVMASGNAVIGEYNVVRSMRTAAFDFERTAAYSLRSIGYEARLAAIQAQRQASAS